MLEPDHEIIGIPDHNDMALRHFPAPGFHPNVEYIMQVHVGEQWRNHCPGPEAKTNGVLIPGQGDPSSSLVVRRPYRCLRPFAVFRYSGFQPFLDQPQDAVIGHPMPQELHRPLMTHWVEKAPDVRIENPVHTSPLEAHIQRV